MSRGATQKIIIIKINIIKMGLYSSLVISIFSGNFISISIYKGGLCRRQLYKLYTLLC